MDPILIELPPASFWHDAQAMAVGHPLMTGLVNGAGGFALVAGIAGGEAWVLLLAAWCLGGFLVMVANQRRLARRMSGGLPAHVTFDDEGVHVEATAADQLLRWSAFQRARRLGGWWVIRLNRSASIPIRVERFGDRADDLEALLQAKGLLRSERSDGTGRGRMGSWYQAGEQ